MDRQIDYSLGQDGASPGYALSVDDALALVDWLESPSGLDPLDWMEGQRRGAALVARLWGSGWVPDYDGEMPTPECTTEDALMEMWGIVGATLRAWAPVVAAAEGGA